MNEDFGLYSHEGTPVPLAGVAVTGDILGRCARLSVTHRFTNQETEAIEAVYRFPLPESAALCGFKVMVGDRMLESIVEKREEAFKLYDEALAEGDGGYLLDEERPNIFTLSVGNMPPGGEAVITIDCIQMLDMEGTDVRFSLPTSISPRYVPRYMPERDGIPEGARIHPEYARQVPYGLSLVLTILDGDLLRSIESPSHTIRIEKQEGVTRVSLSAEQTAMDRDFILNLGYTQTTRNRASRIRHDNEVFLQLDFTPVLPEGIENTGDADRPREIVFVLDCSGSMGGDSIHEAKKALQICLRSLSGTVLFNIYRFGSRFESLYPRSVPYGEQSLEKALTWLASIGADLGGTEVAAPLKHICTTQPDTPLLERDIVLLTDGEVGNEQEVIQIAQTNTDHARFFTVGIGAGPNQHFVQGLARAGRGSHEYIYPGERIEPKVIQLFQKLGKAVIEKVHINWGDGPWESYPVTDSLFQENAVTLFARSDVFDGENDTLTVSAQCASRPLSWKIPIIDVPADGRFIPLFWAREKIRELEEGGGRTKGSRQREKKQASTHKEIIDTSRQYGVLSGLTSFVAIETRAEEDRQTGEIILKKVPVLITAGWHGRGSFIDSSALFTEKLSGKSIAFLSSGASRYLSDLRSCIKNILEPSYSNVYNRDRKIILPHRETTQRMVEGSREDIVYAILETQEVDGGLRLTEELADRLGITLTALQRLSSRLAVSAPVDAFLFVSTGVLLTYLERHFACEKGATWGPLLQKTRDWYEEILIMGHPMMDTVPFTQWVEDFARNFFGA